MEVYVNRDEPWLRWIAPEEFNNADLFRIIVFFVFHSPCRTLSYMNRTLAEYGWHEPWKKPYQLRKQLIQVSTNCELLFSAETYDTMDEELKKGNLYDGFPNNLHTERICVYNTMKNQFLSVFYHIRNSFAHGRLNMVDVDGECVFILEDVVKGDGRLKLSARMIIKKSTLLNWINLIEGGEREYQEKQ